MSDQTPNPPYDWAGDPDSDLDAEAEPDEITAEATGDETETDVPHPINWGSPDVSVGNSPR